MNALGTTLLLLFVGAIICGSRRVALLGLFAVACYVPENQQVLVGGFHFTSVRTAVLAGLLRGLARGDYRKLTLTVIDKALVAYALALGAVGILREGTMAEVVFCLGKDYDIFLLYFVCRMLLTSYEEVKVAVLSLAWLIVPLAIFMGLEARTGNNVFADMGVRCEHEVRHGLIRAQGSFQSAITGGVFGATLTPLFIGLYAEGKRRALLVIGILASFVITVSTVSSAPILALFLVVFCLACWPLRERMRTIRWLIVAGIVGLHLVMKGDVWFIFGHLGKLTGGGGEYRSELIDHAIHHFDQWWLLGFKDTGQWTVHHLANGAADITSQYIRDAVDGGLLGLILLLVLLTSCFRQLGRARKKVRSQGLTEEAFALEWFLWCVGCALVAHVVTIISVEYFDQMRLAWYMLLAIIAVLTSAVLTGELDSRLVSGPESEEANGSLNPEEARADAEHPLKNSEVT